jgi:hypothetical protein
MHASIDNMLFDSRDMTIHVHRGFILLNIEVGYPKHVAVFLMVGVEISIGTKRPMSGTKHSICGTKRPIGGTNRNIAGTIHFLVDLRLVCKYIPRFDFCFCFFRETTLPARFNAKSLRVKPARVRFASLA